MNEPAKITELENLKALIESGDLHHATYRSKGTVWEGIWFYRRSSGPLATMHGFEIAGCVNKTDPDLEEAFQVLAGKGMHVGCFGGG